MKDGIEQIVGRAITAVVVSHNNNAPSRQVFLVFSDGTSFELWGNDLHCAGGLDRQGMPEVIAHLERRGSQFITYARNASAEGS
jgi:hypothetical protein